VGVLSQAGVRADGEKGQTGFWEKKDGGKVSRKNDHYSLPYRSKFACNLKQTVTEIC